MAKRTSELIISNAALDELRSLSSSDTDIVVAFLQNLAENPDDRTLIGAADAKGDIFASRVNDKLRVYWSFDMNHLPDFKLQPKINVLGLARKRANQGFVPLLSVVNEKLKPA